VLEVLIPVLFGFEANKDAVEAPDGLSKEVKTQVDPYSPVSNVTGA
jgi:hypothetical protein